MQLDDKYFLRLFSGMAMQGMLTSISPDMTEPITNRNIIVGISLEYATALLDEIKKREAT